MNRSISARVITKINVSRFFMAHSVKQQHIRQHFSGLKPSVHPLRSFTLITVYVNPWL